jgi:hypothetical protein
MARLRPSATCGAQIKWINPLISILEEDRLATISALGHALRKTRNDHAGESTRAGKISRAQRNRYAVLFRVCAIRVRFNAARRF